MKGRCRRATELRNPRPGGVERADRILVWLCLLTLVFGGLATTVVVFGANAMLARAARTAGPAGAGDHAGMHGAGPTAASDHMEMHPAGPTAAGDHMEMQPGGPTDAVDHGSMHVPATDDGSG